MGVQGCFFRAPTKKPKKAKNKKTKRNQKQKTNKTKKQKTKNKQKKRKIQVSKHNMITSDMKLAANGTNAIGQRLI